MPLPTGLWDNLLRARWRHCAFGTTLRTGLLRCRCPMRHQGRCVQMRQVHLRRLCPMRHFFQGLCVRMRQVHLRRMCPMRHFHLVKCVPNQPTYIKMPTVGLTNNQYNGGNVTRDVWEAGARRQNEEAKKKNGTQTPTNHSGKKRGKGADGRSLNQLVKALKR